MHPPRERPPNLTRAGAQLRLPRPAQTWSSSGCTRAHALPAARSQVVQLRASPGERQGLEAKTAAAERLRMDSDAQRMVHMSSHSVNHQRLQQHTELPHQYPPFTDGQERHLRSSAPRVRRAPLAGACFRRPHWKSPTTGCRLGKRRRSQPSTVTDSWRGTSATPTAPFKWVWTPDEKAHRALPAPGNTAGHGGRPEEHPRRRMLDAIFPWSAAGWPGGSYPRSSHPPGPSMGCPAVGRLPARAPASMTCCATGPASGPDGTRRGHLVTGPRTVVQMLGVSPPADPRSA